MSLFQDIVRNWKVRNVLQVGGRLQHLRPFRNQFPFLPNSKVLRSMLHEDFQGSHCSEDERKNRWLSFCDILKHNDVKRYISLIIYYNLFIEREQEVIL